MTKLKTKENQIEVFEKDEQSWTTSLDVAEKFEKQHKHVLRDIRNLKSQDEDFYRSNFGPIIREVQGGQSEYYAISRDGFSLLAMGFTGKEAIQWKIKYLKAFNLMEKTIIAQAKQIKSPLLLCSLSLRGQGMQREKKCKLSLHFSLKDCAKIEQVSNA